MIKRTIFVFLLLFFAAACFATTYQTYILETISGKSVLPAIKTLKKASFGDVVYLNVDSYGGDVSSGMVLIAAMKTTGAKVVVVTHDTAMSMAAFILSANGKNIEVDDNAQIMFHPLSIGGVPITLQNANTKPQYQVIFMQEDLLLKKFSPLTSKEILAVESGKEVWLTGKQFKSRILHNNNTGSTIMDPM